MKCPSLPPHRLPLAFGNELWSSLAMRTCKHAEGISALATDEQHYFAVGLFEAQFLSGGIDQFFLNYSGEYYKQVVSGLQAIGAEQTSGLLVIAAHLFFLGDNPPTDYNERWDVLTSCRSLRWTTPLDVLDSAVINSNENLPEMLNRFAIQKGLIK